MAGCLCALACVAAPRAARAQSDPGSPPASVLAHAAEAPSSGAPPPAYRELMGEGLEAYQQGRWAEARALFLRGHDVAPNARSYRVLGMTAFNLTQYASAVRELSAALEDARRPLSGNLRTQTQSLLSRADIFVGRYQLSLDPVDAVLWIDGVEARYEADGSILLGVGSHVLEAEAEAHRSLTRPILVDGTDGETLRFHLTPRTLLPEPSSTPVAAPSVELAPVALGPSTPREDSSRNAGVKRVFSDYAFTWGAAAGALGLAGAAVGLHGRALRKNAPLEETCDGMCSPFDGVTDARDRSLRASRATAASAAVCAVGALVAYFIERRRAER